LHLEREQNKEYTTAIYIRLSKEDGDKEESESVSNQRKILKAFARENKYKIYDEYVDDGYTGTNFDRPDFKRMIRDIEDGKVNMVITKSLSRLGRDYIETGRYIESYFLERQIRYIAILDDVDTFLYPNPIGYLPGRTVSGPKAARTRTDAGNFKHTQDLKPYWYFQHRLKAALRRCQPEHPVRLRR